MFSHGNGEGQRQLTGHIWKNKRENLGHVYMNLFRFTIPFSFLGSVINLIMHCHNEL